MTLPERLQAMHDSLGPDVELPFGEEEVEEMRRTLRQAKHCAVAVKKALNYLRIGEKFWAEQVLQIAKTKLWE